MVQQNAGEFLQPVDGCYLFTRFFRVVGVSRAVACQFAVLFVPGASFRCPRNPPLPLFLAIDPPPARAGFHHTNTRTYAFLDMAGRCLLLILVLESVWRNTASESAFVSPHSHVDLSP